MVKSYPRQLLFLPLLFAFFAFISKSNAQCTASIGANIKQGCEVLTIQFNDLSAGAVQQRIWIFGDGTPTSGAQSPTHSYNAGIVGDTTYIVSLSIQCIGGMLDTITDTIRVYKKPTVQFTPNKTNVCALSDSICFTNNSSSGVGYIYAWNFGDGNSSSTSSPCHVYSTPGVYAAQLTVTNNNGCVNSITGSTLSVISSPNPDFTLTPLLGCAPQNVTITNTTDTITSIISSWSWDFGDGSPNFTGSQPGSHTFVAAGTYFIKLTATNSLGCSNRTTKAIVVRTSPTANFTATSPICLNDSSLVTFTGAASSIASFAWNFGGGTGVPGTGRGPHKVNWTTAGIHNISLTVTDSSCSANYTVPVTVYPNALISLTVSPNDTICQNQQLTFTATPGNYTNYTFYVNNSIVQNSLSNIYLTSSLVNGDQVKVSATNLAGCSNTSNVITIHINPVPVITLSSSASTICVGGSITFTASPSGLNNYTFYDGSSVLQSGAGNTYTYNNPANGRVISVIGSNTGCPSSLSNTIGITVVQHMLPPVVNCGTTTTTSVEFTWGSVAGAVSYAVSINSGAYAVPSSGASGLTHLVTGLTAGDTSKIIVRAIGAAPCIDTTYSVLTKCVAILCSAPVTYNYTSAYNVCTGTNLNLALTSISAANYGVSWNGGPYTTATTFTVSAVSNSTITVSVVDSAQLACPATNGVITINVGTKPTVTLSSAPQDSVCQGSSVIFTASPSNLTNYAFYNGSVLLQSGVGNTYTTSSLLPGNTISVIATDVACDDTSNTISILIVQPLQPPQVVCDTTTNTSVKFVWNSVNGATGYQVSINNGPFITPSSGSTGLTHLVTSLTPGAAVTIVIRALGNGACGNSAISVPVTCFATPCTTISYSINSSIVLCKGDTATLSVNNITAQPYQVSWNGGAPTTSTTYTIAPTADTLITVEVSDPNQPSCVPAIKYFNIQVLDKPVNVTVTSSSANDTICRGSSLTFTALPAGYTNYAFYDGFLLLQNTNNNVYQNTNWINGHTVTVIAGNQGCLGGPSNSITTTVINPLNVPQVNCGNSTDSTIEFTWNNIVDATGYEVSVNGGPFITPSSGSTGLLHLITGLTTGMTRTIVVRALGNAPCGNSASSASHTCTAVNCTAITYSVSPSLYISTCQSDTVTLSLSSISTASPSISWNGGTPGTATTIDVIVTKDTIVSVSVTDLLQPTCTPTSNQFIITRIPTPTVTISSSAPNDSLCLGQSITITSSPAGYDNYAFYNNATLLQSSNNPGYTTTALTSGNSLTVIATNMGCTSTSNTKVITILALPTVTLTSAASNDTSCFGDTITFTASPAGYDSYTFYNGGPALQNSTSNIFKIPSLAVGNSNTITVVATNNGCSGNASNTITTQILALPVVTLSSSDANNTICNGDVITFSASPAGLINYVFSNGGTTLQNSASNTYTTSGLATGNVITVTGTDTKGCQSQASAVVTITVNPLPNPTLSASDTGVCAGASTTILVSLAAQFSTSTILWSTGATGSIAIGVNPTTATQYYVIATYNGCPDTGFITIDVDSSTPPIASAGSDVTVCLNDSVQLSGSGGLLYEWTPSYGLSNSMVSNPKTGITQSTMYRVKVTNTYCFTMDSVLVTLDRCLEDITGPIPSVITPNGDGSNDNFVIPDLDYFKDNEILIYNRWGNLVYGSKPYLNDWYGVSNSGKDLPDGVYYYILDLGNDSKPRSGYVVITR